MWHCYNLACMDFDILTRLLVAVAYGAAAVTAARIPQAFNIGRTLTRLWVGILASWSTWYVVLAVVNPSDIGAWGFMSRLLHVPLALYVITTSVLARRFYTDNPHILDVLAGGDGGTDGV